MSGFAPVLLSGSSTGVPRSGTGFVVPSASGATATFNADGTTTGTTGTPNWFAPTTSSIGSSYWARTTKTGGNRTFTPGDGTWYSLASGQAIGVTGGVGGACVGTIDFATDSGGSNLVATLPLKIQQ